MTGTIIGFPCNWEFVCFVFMKLRFDYDGWIEMAISYSILNCLEVQACVAFREFIWIIHS